MCPFESAFLFHLDFAPTSRLPEWTGEGAAHISQSLPERPSESRAEDQPYPVCPPVNLRPFQGQQDRLAFDHALKCVVSAPVGGETQGLRERE